MDTLLVKSANVYRHPKVILAVALVLTLVLGAAIPFLKFDNNIRNMLPQHNHDLKVHDYYEDESRFGSSSYVFLGVKSDDVWSDASLIFLKTLQIRLDALNLSLPEKNTARLLGLSEDEGKKLVDAIRSLGVNEGTYRDELIPVITNADQLKEKFGFDDSLAAKVAKAAKAADPEQIYSNYEPPIHKLEALVDSDYITNRDDSLVVEKLLDDDAIQVATDGTVTVAPGTGAKLKAKAASWEIYDGVLFSQDGKLGTMVISLNTHDIGVKASLNKALGALLAEVATPGITTYLDGETIIEDKIASYMTEDLKILLPLVVIVVVLVLFFCFRKIQGVIYPGVVIVMGVVWAVGLEAWLGIPVTVVGTAMPVLLVAIASAYGIHQMNHYLLDSGHDKLHILTHNMKTVGLAILLSGITVMVGFGSLITSDFVPVKNFGILTAFGDLVAVAAALFVLPAMILAGKKPKMVEYHESEKGLIGGLLHWFVRVNKKYPVAVLVVSLVLTVVFAVGCFSVKAELNNVSLFQSNDPTRIADDTLNAKLAGTQVMNVVIDSDLSDIVTRTGAASDEAPVEVTTPAVLHKIEAFNAAVLKEFPYVTKVLSFNTMMKKMNQEMTGGDPAQYAIPQDAALISQYLLIFSGDLQSYLSPNHDKLRVSVTMKRTSTDESEKVAQFALKYFDNDFRQTNHVQVQITGAAHLYYVANTLLIAGTINSVLVCVVIVFLLLLFVLRDFWISLVAMIPIFITLVINYGMLGLFNIPLNAGTAMVSTVAIGIGVDYSIHFITWYRMEIRRRRDVEFALEQTILHKGRAILYNMLVIVGGFMVMVVSKFVPLVQFGVLVSVCMITTAVGALVTVPAVMKLLAKKERKFLYME